MVVVVGHDGDSIVQLEVVGIRGVVDQDDVFEVAIRDYSEVFYVHALDWLVAMLTEYSLGNELVLAVQIVQNDICVTRMTSSKN